MDEAEARLWDEMFLRSDAHQRATGSGWTVNNAKHEATDAVLARRAAMAELTKRPETPEEIYDRWAKGDDCRPLREPFTE